jgi:N-hydroxyarylamine O-acetyltransferase
VELAAYLRRIGCTFEPRADLATLRALHHAHLLHVPFENLDVHWDRPIVLDEPAFYRKIVGERRGGFCYELNGLFAWALRGLGFRVTLLAANVHRADGTLGGDFGHLALQVDLDHPWLADVGFGDAFREPLALDDDAPQVQIDRAYRLRRDGDLRVVDARLGEGDWQPRYRFALRGHALSAFAAACAMHQSAPDSHFRQNRVCTLALPEGRVTLWNLRLIETDLQGVRTERELPDWAAFYALASERFGLARQAVPEA